MTSKIKITKNFRISVSSLKKSAEEFPKNQCLLKILEKQPKNAEIKEEYCDVHKQKFEFICVDCKKRLCFKCALFDGHKEHDIRAEEELLNELIMRGDCLRELLQIIEDNSQAFNKRNEIQQAYEKCVGHEKEIHTLIELKFQEYLEVLKSKKANVMRCLGNIVLAISDKFAAIKQMPKNLPNKVVKWKEEYLEFFLNILELRLN